MPHDRARSASIDAEERETIGGAITAKTAVIAKKWGGKKYVKTLIETSRIVRVPSWSRLTVPRWPNS
jgi:hypothetical protein